jgi:DNA-binding beta-propeller fold protein YncE
VAASVVVLALAIGLPLGLRSKGQAKVRETVISVPSSFLGLVRMDPKTQDVLARIPLRGNYGEGGGTFAAGSMWLSGSTGVDRVDVKTGKRVAHIPVTGGGAQIAGGEKEGIWLTTHAPEENAVWQIDPAKNEITGHVDLPGHPYVGPYVGEGFVWVGSTNTIWKIDPGTGRILKSTPYNVPTRATDNIAAAGLGALWIADPDELTRSGGSYHHGAVIRFDAETDKVTVIPARWVDGLAVGGGAVWARSGRAGEFEGTGDIIEINPSTNRLIRTIHVGHPDWISANRDGIWVQNGATTILLNPATGKIVGRIHIPRGFGFQGEWNGSYWLERLRFE